MSKRRHAHFRLTGGLLPHAQIRVTKSFLRPTPITFNLTILTSCPLHWIAFTSQPPFKVECQQLRWKDAVHLAFTDDHSNFEGGGVNKVPSCACDRQVKCDWGGLIFQWEDAILYCQLLCARAAQALDMLTTVAVFGWVSGRDPKSSQLHGELTEACVMH